MSSNGVPPEWLMPYDISKFTQSPSKVVTDYAAQHKIGQYFSVGQQLDQMKHCLASGYPFIFGFSVYESFESDAVARTGIMPMPGKNEQVLGGHAVMAVGYDDKSKYFKVRNSWGTSWGQKGYFQMPYDFILNNGLADDFWTAESIS